MGALDQLEAFLQDLVERPAWLLGSRSLQPLEIASALTRELEAHAVRLQDRILIPTDYEILIASADYSRLGRGLKAFEDELAGYVEALAAERDLSLPRAATVVIRPSGELEPAQVRVRAASPGASSSRSETTGGYPSLVLLGPGGEEIRVFPLDHSPMRLGRSHENDICLVDTKISRSHAQLDEREGRYVLRDLGSTNGTYLNGVEITEPAPVRSGDVIAVGALRLRFRSTEAQPERGL